RPAAIPLAFTHLQWSWSSARSMSSLRPVCPPLTPLDRRRSPLPSLRSIWNPIQWVSVSSGVFRGRGAGSPEATRRASNKRFLLDLAEDWQQHGREVFKRVRRESPAVYLKVCALLLPREMKLEHSGGVKAMTDEQLERSIEILKEMIAQRDAAAS